MRSVGRLMGAVGLLVTSIAGVIAVLAVAVAPGVLPNLLMITAVGLAAWTVGASLEADVAFTQTLLWLGAFVIVGAAAIGGVLALATLGRAIGIDGDWAIRLALLVVSFVVAVVSATWARGRPDRGAAPMAIARLAIGRPTQDDRALLAHGPGPLLRRRPPGPGTPVAHD